MTPMRQTFGHINRLLSMDKPEHHVLEVRMLLEELFARARDGEEQKKAVVTFASATLSYLRGIEADTLQQTQTRRQEVEERAQALLATMFLRRGQTIRKRA
jgi:hypothetical protein